MLIKVMTYNIHHGIDKGKNYSLPDIIEVIRRENPHLAVLNEIETYKPRSYFQHQPKKISRALNMKYIFGPTIKFGPWSYGNCIFSRLPIIDFKNILLNSMGEPRACLVVSIESMTIPIKIAGTHLGLNKNEKINQINQLAKFVGNETMPQILCGDFNCSPSDTEPIRKFLSEAFSALGKTEHNTYPSDKPLKQLDYIFFSKHFNIIDVYTITSTASDHLPVVALLEL